MTLSARTALWAQAWPGLADCDLAISPADDMLAGALDEIGDLDQAVVAYLRSGLEVAGVWRRLMAQDDTAGGMVLDFASGYGRVTRFLAPLLRDRLEIADIDARAVAQQAAQFGVRTFVAPADPFDLGRPSQYSWVLVTSLFTHLPLEATRCWLRALAATVAPDGVLALTYHDVALLGAAQHATGGFVFEPSSESRVLSTATYGSTWMSRAWLTEVWREAMPDFHLCFHPRVFGERQDLLLASRHPRVDSLVPRRAPFGYFERIEVDADSVSLHGWALDLGTGKALEALEVWIAGARVEAEVVQDLRPDVTGRYGLPPDQPVAYRVRFRRPQLDNQAIVLIGRTTLGVEGVLEARNLEGYRLRRAQLELAQERDEVRFWRGRFAEVEAAHVARGVELATARAKLEAVEASRFWRLRRSWFALKRRLGLPAIE